MDESVQQAQKAASEMESIELELLPLSRSSSSSNLQVIKPTKEHGMSKNDVNQPGPSSRKERRDDRKLMKRNSTFRRILNRFRPNRDAIQDKIELLKQESIIQEKNVLPAETKVYIQ